MTVLEVQRWESNSDLVEAAFRMHVFPKPWAQKSHIEVLDPTFGRGVWWQWMDGWILLPDGTVDIRHASLDIPKQRLNVTARDIRWNGDDYRNLPHENEMFDVVAFDPDYVAPGGRDTSTINEFNSRYGLKEVYESPATLQASINEGVAECARVVYPQGIVLVKCMNYVSSGKLWLGERHTIDAGLAVGLVVEDIFVHLGDPGPQPEHKRQMHARSNSSRLLVFRRPGRRKK